MVTKFHLFPRRGLAVSLTMPQSVKKRSRFSVREAILDRLRDNSVEEIIFPPDIVNQLSVSNQANGKRRLILDLRHKNENLHTIKKLLQKTFLPSLLI